MPNYWRLMAALTLTLSASMALSAEAAAPSTARVTGRFLDFNGTRQVPRGLFGVHATALTPERITEWGVESVRLIHAAPSGSAAIAGGKGHESLRGLRHFTECFFDRYQPATILTHPMDWQARLTDLARRYAESAKGLEAAHTVEFWNEPYLNWSIKPGVNYDGDFYEVSQAREGEAVFAKGSATPYPTLVWHRGLMAVDAATGAKDYVAWGYAPKTIHENGIERPVRAGDEYVFRGKKRMKFIEHWLVRDTSQISYWAGQFNAELYRRMLVPFARAIKETNPSLEVVGGFDFHIYQGRWDAWRSCFKPMIDEAWQWIDGVDEHHYGEDTRRTAASYELVAGYSQARYGKWLRVYNTEAGGMLDPQRPDTVATSSIQGEPLEKAIGTFTFGVRDILYLIAKCPDKAVTRYAHQAEQNGGDEWVFKLLKPLRGRLLECVGSDPDLWVVASLEGSRLCVVAFNDSAKSKPAKIDLDLPAGFVAGSIRRASVVARPREKRLELIESTQEHDRHGMIRLLADIPSRSAVRWTSELTGTSARQSVISRRQYFAPTFLTPIEPGAALKLTIDAPPGRLSPGAASFRCTFSGQPVEVRALINGHSVVTRSPEPICDTPIDPTWLKPKNVIEITITGGAVQLDTCSLLIDTSEAEESVAK